MGLLSDARDRCPLEHVCLTHRSVNVFTAPGKAMVGESGQSLGEAPLLNLFAVDFNSSASTTRCW